MNNFHSPKEVAEAYDNISVSKAKNSITNLFILGVLAGIYIAFAGFASQTISYAIENPGLSKFASGAVFPVGLILVVLAGAELFTGNNLMIIGFMDKKISFSELLRNWIVVYIANFIGSVLFAFLISRSGLFDSAGGLLGATAIKTAIAKVSLPFSQALIRGLLCNIMVVLAVWMATAAKDIVSKISAIWFPIMLFVMSGFEHSIANMYFIPAGIFAKSNADYLKAGQIEAASLSKLNLSGLFANLVPVTVGNILGGAIIIGLSYWYVYRYTSDKINFKK
ncbi:MAG: formate/nitrite transporter family protein [Tepidanaerobacter acetatoxydans]|uniref:formate/nitrite transporter family protein n=1 Tax=Tepidanaerobacter acetatoxydans TaxID=499229 RepID=UPI0026EA94E8|nr:formate/nitrite transporter family protein [Tepidanaerobacter acetatoxydans]NLU11054.1 formate/nitrite transporter family protein [Tepidanaerobacter acetatoxydans]